MDRITKITDLPICIKSRARASKEDFKSLGILEKFFPDNDVFIFVIPAEVGVLHTDFVSSLDKGWKVVACEGAGICNADTAILTAKVMGLQAGMPNLSLLSKKRHSQIANRYDSQVRQYSYLCWC